MGVGGNNDKPVRALLNVTRTQLSALLVHHDLEHDRSLGAALLSLGESGFLFNHVLDIDSAIGRLKNENAFDVVVLDYGIVEKGELTSVFALRKAAPHIPLVLIGHKGREREALAAAQHGAQDVLFKSDLHAEFFDWKLRNAIHQHRIGDALETRIGELEVTNGRFLSLVADNADAILVVDKIGVVRFVNPSAERLMRCTAQELLGQMFGIPLEGVDLTEIDLTNRPGGVRTAEIRVTDTLWDGDKANIVTMRDVTERKRIELALKLAKQSAEQASEMKSQFLANMSHELRTPLNAIIGYSEIMMLGVGGKIRSKRFREYVKDIHSGGKHLLSLINDLLDLAKAESGKLELTEDNFDLVGLATEIGEIIAGEAIRKGIQFEVRCERKSIWLRGDERMLKQIALNLISNALKFTKRSGRVTLSVDRTQAGDVSIMVTDTGIGMPNEQIPKAFTAFVQIDNVYSRDKNHGTGLGLALTKRFVELHQGHIAIESEVEVGTVVTITLPRARVVSSTRGESAIVTQLDISRLRSASRK